MRNKLRSVMERLTRPGDTVTCALSGGADSVSMTCALHSLREELGITVRACHFNHHLRGNASDGDEDFCRALCRQLDIPLTVGHGRVDLRCGRTGESLEEAARALRYEFFSGQPGWVATAHTADDNAETVLLNLIRGTGLKGLCGIPETRDNLIRPMLGVTRDEVLHFLQEADISHREDATNGEDSCLRNRLRHGVLPRLKEENPGFLSGIARMTENLRQDETLLQAQADCLLESGSAAALAAAPQALRRRAIRSLLSPVPKLTAAHIAAVENLVLQGGPSSRVNLPGGLVARRQYDRLLVEPAAAAAAFAPVTLPCPGQVYLPELNVTFRCLAGPGAPVVIRPRQTGDTITLPGGSKTVKKLLIDKKIPAADRERIPILTAGGRILSVWGVADAADNPYTITMAEGDL